MEKIDSVVDESDGSVARTAFSSLLRDAHDYTCMFTDQKAESSPRAHLRHPVNRSHGIGSQNLVTKLPLKLTNPATFFITNDPWALAGHLNDVCVLSPIFYKNKVVAFTACVFHHSDIGAASRPTTTRL